jgi:hypothetical protein
VPEHKKLRQKGGLKMHQTMPLKHRVCINVCDGRGNKQPVLRSGTARIPKRLLKWLFGDFCEVLVLTPGMTVGEVEIHELPREVDSDAPV